jgi:hypothetical protein
MDHGIGLTAVHPNEARPAVASSELNHISPLIKGISDNGIFASATLL